MKVKSKAGAVALNFSQLESDLRLLDLNDFAADMKDATGVAVCKLELQTEEDLRNFSYRLRVIVTYRPTPDGEWCCEVVEHQIPFTERWNSRMSTMNLLFNTQSERAACVLTGVLTGMLSGVMPAMAIDAAMARSGLGVRSRALVAPEVDAVTLR